MRQRGRVQRRLLRGPRRRRSIHATRAMQRQPQRLGALRNGSQPLLRDGYVQLSSSAIRTLCRGIHVPPPTGGSDRARKLHEATCVENEKLDEMSRTSNQLVQRGACVPSTGYGCSRPASCPLWGTSDLVSLRPSCRGPKGGPALPLQPHPPVRRARRHAPAGAAVVGSHDCIHHRDEGLAG